MQINRSTDYAVRVMIHLALLPPGERANREKLAGLAEVPAEFLGKVLQTLARAGLLLSRRGAEGGFELARAASRITMLDVVEALEGTLHLNECLTGENQCGRAWWCSAHDVWRDAQAAVRRVLAGVTIEQLAREASVRRRAGAQADAHETRPLVQLGAGGTSWS
jgi:Rrf2 family protein